MKFLIILRTEFFLKNFSETIRSLLSDGHEVEVLFSNTRDGIVGQEVADSFAEEFPQVGLRYHTPTKSLQNRFDTTLRLVTDVSRYNNVEFDEARALRQRAKNKVKAPSASILSAVYYFLERFFGKKKTFIIFENAILGLDVDRSIKNVIEEIAPDKVVVSPYTPIGSEQFHWVKAAKFLKIPVIYCMYSWDNLSNKGVLLPRPDLAIVWNKFHVKEAQEMHHLDAKHIKLGGAPGTDIWMNRNPKWKRSEFLREIGLDENDDFILYAGSSIFIGGSDEPELFRVIMQEIKNLDPKFFSTVKVIVRPHPQNAKQWKDFDLQGLDNVIVHSNDLQVPYRGQVEEEYFSLIYFSSAVLGINTSSMVEAGVIGKPVVSMPSDFFGAKQRGTLHFRHLLETGLIFETNNSAELYQQLQILLRPSKQTRLLIAEKSNNFISQYIRPNDVTIPAARYCADAMQLPVLSTGKNTYVEKSLYLILSLFLRFLAALVNGITCLSPRRIVHFILNTLHFTPKEKAKLQTSIKNSFQAAILYRRSKDIDDKNHGRKPIYISKHIPQPFQGLPNVAKAYGQAQSGRSILLFGDSVMQRVSDNDKNRTSLCDMIASELKKQNTSIVPFVGSAYTLTLFATACKALHIFENRPDAIILPINLRSFSPQWMHHPAYQFEDETNAIEKFISDGKLMAVDSQPFELDMDKYDATHIKTENNNYSTIGEFNLLLWSTPRSKTQMRLRDKAISSFFYLYQLESDNKSLKALKDILETVGGLNIPLLIYSTPVNWVYGTKLHGGIFRKIISDHLMKLEQFIVEHGSKKVKFIDFTFLFNEEYFFSDRERTEHLNETGRERLSEKIRANLGEFQ